MRTAGKNGEAEGTGRRSSLDGSNSDVLAEARGRAVVAVPAPMPVSAPVRLPQWVGGAASPKMEPEAGVPTDGTESGEASGRRRVAKPNWSWERETVPMRLRA